MGLPESHRASKFSAQLRPRSVTDVVSYCSVLLFLQLKRDLVDDSSSRMAGIRSGSKDKIGHEMVIMMTTTMVMMVVMMVMMVVFCFMLPSKEFRVSVDNAMLLVHFHTFSPLLNIANIPCAAIVISIIIIIIIVIVVIIIVVIIIIIIIIIPVIVTPSSSTSCHIISFIDVFAMIS